MKRVTFIVFVLVMVLATCKAPEPNMPAPADVPAMETAVPPTPTEEAAPQGKLPGPPFPAKLYVSKTGNFALDLPDGWTVRDTATGDRSTQILFVSSSDLADASTLPEGATRVTAMIYQWDPKNDLAAFTAHMKEGWEASGFSILSEQQLTLEQGLPAVEFTIQTPDTQSLFLAAAIKDQYIVLGGEGDLDLAKQIVERVRPISQ